MQVPSNMVRLMKNRSISTSDCLATAEKNSALIGRVHCAQSGSMHNIIRSNKNKQQTFSNLEAHVQRSLIKCWQLRECRYHQAWSLLWGSGRLTHRINTSDCLTLATVPSTRKSVRSAPKLVSKMDRLGWKECLTLLSMTRIMSDAGMLKVRSFALDNPLHQEFK